MDLIEAIQTRHSVRKYTDQPIEVAKLATLRNAIDEVNAQSGLNIQLVINEPKGFNGLFISTYGQFSGVKNYIVMAAPKGKEWEEKVGYYGEKLVLLAQTLGLNTCWAGLTYKKVAGAFSLRDGDIITKFLKKTSGQGILARSRSSIGSPPQLIPLGSIHIITAPPTAPTATKMVSIFRSSFIEMRFLSL